MAADRKLRIEVGYGLEAQVPDAIASRVINDVIVPRIQAGDRDGAVTSLSKVKTGFPCEVIPSIASLTRG